jgi:Tfp pilus assembly protein PilO
MSMRQNLFYKKEFLIGAGFVVLDLCILILGGWFLTSKIIDSSSQLKEKKATVSAIYQGWQEMSAEQRQLDKIKPEVELLNQGLVSAGQPIELISLLENLAQKTDNLYDINLVPASLDVSSGKNEPPALLFQITLGGSFPNFMHFLSYLENMEYLNNIESIETQEAGSASGFTKEWNLPPGSVYSVIGLRIYTK